MSQGASSAGRPLAIIAGGGAYPPLLAAIAKERGHEVFVAALQGSVLPQDFAGFDSLNYRLGQLGRLLDDLKQRGITDLVMIGSLPRPSFGGLMPEASTLKHLPYFARAFKGGDDHLLTAVVKFFESQGFQVHGPAEIAPALTAPAGRLGRLQPSAAAHDAIARGFDLLAALSPFDVGQAAILADHRVVAIEAAEGTDAMIERVGALVAAGRLKIAKGDGVLIKAPKDSQDLRVDMPAIGPRTLELAAAAGLSGIALRAGKVLVGDAAGLGALADRAGLFVEGVV